MAAVAGSTQSRGFKIGCAAGLLLTGPRMLENKETGV